MASKGSRLRRVSFVRQAANCSTSPYSLCNKAQLRVKRKNSGDHCCGGETSPAPCAALAKEDLNSAIASGDGLTDQVRSFISTYSKSRGHLPLTVGRKLARR